MIKNRYDAIVIGGGPAGSTAAALVAEAGFSVLQVERESMPRPHVGESLMPETYWIFQRLGVLEKMRASPFPHKVGVQFVNNTGRESAPFFFRSHDPHESSQTWHVDRAEFDQMLWNNAAEKGAQCCDATRALKVKFENNQAQGVLLQQAAAPLKEVATQIVLDATGQQSLLATTLNLRQMNPDLRKASIWGHFRGGLRDEQGGGVKTVILRTRSNKNWFWYIPMSGDRVSVGVVGDRDALLKGRGTPEETFQEELRDCDMLQQWLADASQVAPLQVLKEFSYSTTRSAGDGWALVGDAWGFIDPVYSSGVYFALKSAELAADAAIEGLRTGDVSAAMLGRWVPDFQRQTNLLRKLVHAFYSGEFRVGKFIQEFPQHRDELVDLLIGRIFDGCQGQIFKDLDPWLQRATKTS